MFRHKSSHQWQERIVFVNVSGHQTPGIVGFCMKPPITVHDPEFMGFGIKMAFSDDVATYGTAPTPPDLSPGHAGWQEIIDYLRPAFEDGLQTFLGKSSLRMEIVHGSGTEM